jgi:hypothetical protein
VNIISYKYLVIAMSAVGSQQKAAPKARNKYYTPVELRHLAMAYLNATNTIKGTDQKKEVFFAKIVDNLRHYAPANVPDGTYHHRGLCVYSYLRDTVFKDCQRFNASLRLALLPLADPPHVPLEIFCCKSSSEESSSSAIR